MPTITAINNAQHRLSEQFETTFKAYEAGQLSTAEFHGYMDRIEAEQDELDAQRNCYAKALRYRGGPGENAQPPGTPPGALPENSNGQGEGARMATRKQHLPSPTALTTAQLESLFLAGENMLPSYSCRVGDLPTKSLGEASLTHKQTPVAEGTPTQIAAGGLAAADPAAPSVHAAPGADPHRRIPRRRGTAHRPGRQLDTAHVQHQSCCGSGGTGGKAGHRAGHGTERNRVQSDRWPVLRVSADVR